MLSPYSEESLILYVKTRVTNKETFGKGRDTAHGSRTL